MIDGIFCGGESTTIGKLAVMYGLMAPLRDFAARHPVWGTCAGMIFMARDIGRDSIDVVIDLVAGAQWPDLLDVLRPGGRYGVAGAIGGPMVDLDVRTLYLKDLTLYGCTVLEPEVFGNLVRRIERAEVSPMVAATYPLHQIAEAQKAFAEKRYAGKIVLTV